MLERSRKLRFIATSMLGIIVALAAFVFVASDRAVSRRYAVPRPWLAPSGPVSFRLEERGRHIATVVAQCQFCHGTDLGGKEIADDPLIGRIDSTNLTRGAGGVARDFADADWERAIRSGLRRDGRSLLLMPSRHLATISDEDLRAVIAYLRQVPEIDRVARPVRIGPLTRVAVAFGAVDDIFSARDAKSARQEASEASAPAHAATPEYGAYLVELGNCRVCHHADLQGGLHALALPGEPPPPRLRGVGAMPGWGYPDFERAMRSGLTPEGRLLEREYMPWPSFAGLSEVELRALWSYLSGVEEEASMPGADEIASLPAAH